MAAIILAAGKGKRLKKDISKVLLPLFNKPLISYAVDLLEAASIPIYVVVGYNKEQVKKTVGKKARYVEQDELLGTGHAVICVLPVLEKEIKNVIVMMGDHSFALTYDILLKLQQVHDKTNAEITLLTVLTKNTAGYGRIVRSKNGDIQGIIDGKESVVTQKKQAEITPGVYVFKTSFLNEFLNSIDKNLPSGEYYLSDLVEIAYKNKKKIAHWQSTDEKLAIGINTLADLKKAQKLLQK